MNVKRRNLIAIVAVIAVPLAKAVADANDKSAERPNIVIVFADDQGYNDLGCFGSDKIKTPHLDRLAKEGMRFTSFYAQAVCGPSRAALMTGCYPIRCAEPSNRKNQHTVLHPREITIAELLKRAGYATACIGKWHLGQRDGEGWNPATMPNGQGFDYFYGTPLYNGFTVQVEDTKFRSPLVRNGKVIKEAIESWDDITAEYTREATEFIESHKDEPFFLYLAHNMPHIPLGASRQFKGKSDYGPYGDAIEEIDWSTGQIVATLDKLGIASRTLVIFTSDNGPWIETTRGNAPGLKPFIPRNHSGTADPLRGYKMLTWEGGLRVPCVVWWPGKVSAGRTCDEVAATIDLFPTMARLAGTNTPDDHMVDGRDIWPLMSGQQNANSPHDEIGFFYYRYTALEAVRSGRWKLVLPRPEHPKWTGWSGRFHGSGIESPELYDLDGDKSEARNVSDKHPEIVKQLMTKIEHARADLGDYDQIGKGARFFDDGPRRPDLWRGGGNAHASPRKTVVYDKAEPAGDLRFDFEQGDLQGWRVVEGTFDQPVTDRNELPNHRYQPFNKQGRYLVFTGHRGGQKAGDDSFVGVIQSPPFVLLGDRMSFLVGGGEGKQTYVALCSQDGKELLAERGTNGPALKRINWDVKKYKGETLVLRIVDRSRGGWGHVTFDDFSCEGRLTR
jgi:arylsulfatase A-like enzyme